ncbi:keratinocyte differentiation factor 1-like isoform X1 [Stegostoma tigrinum]|uniref:keratinocyte differentiation factor 1-like isoform X1 n=1 Tax=Stegostoma tigrinum TaxID=3053191 RepID=UPI00202B7277|nr:keratinocyte differentiation factor 1-like isoform X1 [Stegostoma tigrinum]XP_048413945.1 keratinocyte differentiation factor 1-like isoform X1 [Stegostoma tigrinum]XP_048413946.1 keratinocyte differentiation factor 1-like isoform X1 [Stegostoma tigrinum]XP_059510323.1 keratinocyte differentiation factor 1-like isoform X1 [Stegostoma tigrinum]
MQGTGRRAAPQQADKPVAKPSLLASPVLLPASVDSLNLEVYEGSTPESRRAERKERKSLAKSHRCKADPRDSNGNNSENIGFIPGSVETTEEASVCESCGLGNCVTWQTVKAVFCCVVTCGIYKADTGVYNPCTRTTEPPTHAKDIDSNTLRYIENPVTPPNSKSRPTKKANLAGNSFNYYDVKLGGQQVIWKNNSHTLSTDSCHKDTHHNSQPSESPSSISPISHKRISDEFPSFLEEDLENNELNVSMSSAELDEYINKKLLELFSIHQIDMLAQCTSDTTFISKSSEITELIDSITKGYKINEKDAECRIVTGIVRISTRKPKKSKKRGPEEPTEERLISPTPADPRPQTETILPSEDLNLEISVVDSLDERARQIQRLCSPGLRKDDSLQDTETDSSGAPLLKVYI